MEYVDVQWYLSKVTGNLNCSLVICSLTCAHSFTPFTSSTFVLVTCTFSSLCYLLHVLSCPFSFPSLYFRALLRVCFSYVRIRCYLVNDRCITLLQSRVYRRSCTFSQQIPTEMDRLSVLYTLSASVKV